MTNDDLTVVWAQHVDTLVVQRMPLAVVRIGGGWREITAEQAADLRKVDA